jgi:excinuclease UvrABC ATPase subunit
MNFQASKIELVQRILKSENEELIQKLLQVFTIEKDDFWHELSSSQQEDILKGIEESEQGKVKKWSEVRDSA